jgi:hypothetical protein
MLERALRVAHPKEAEGVKTRRQHLTHVFENGSDDLALQLAKAGCTVARMLGTARLLCAYEAVASDEADEAMRKARRFDYDAYSYTIKKDVEGTAAS